MTRRFSHQLLLFSIVRLDHDFMSELLEIAHSHDHTSHPVLLHDFAAHGKVIRQFCQHSHPVAAHRLRSLVKCHNPHHPFERFHSHHVCLAGILPLRPRELGKIHQRETQHVRPVGIFLYQVDEPAPTILVRSACEAHRLNGRVRHLVLVEHINSRAKIPGFVVVVFRRDEHLACGPCSCLGPLDLIHWPRRGRQFVDSLVHLLALARSPAVGPFVQRASV
mmetsp:Transcript_17190/g.40315  ORF Transcript_17190/g.40315 Transcript_17190/m.40315 type:complete len:221 (-) Transcript_17190:305-967(-)